MKTSKVCYIFVLGISVLFIPFDIIMSWIASILSDNVETIIDHGIYVLPIMFLCAWLCRYAFVQAKNVENEKRVQ